MKTKFRVEAFIGDKFELEVMGGKTIAKVIGVDLVTSRGKVMSTRVEYAHYEEGYDRISSMDISYLKGVRNIPSTKVELIHKFDNNQEVLIIKDYVGDGMELKKGKVENIKFIVDKNRLYNVSYFIRGNWYRQSEVFTSPTECIAYLSRKLSKF